MSLDPDERLAALRREVDAETASTAAPSPPGAKAPDDPPIAETAPADPPIAAPALPSSPAAPRPSPAPPPSSPATPTPRAAPSSTPTPRAAPSSPAVPSRPATPATVDEPGPPSTGDGWDLQELLADTRLSVWLGIGLLAIGGYLVLSWFVPGIDLIGSLLILAAGVVVLAQHFMRGAGPWALYLGAVLTGLGAARILGDILPGSPHGMSAMGIGIAFLAISYLRHTQAGGYGWQGILGAAAVGLGLVQFVLGLLPGSPGLADLILPALLLGGGGYFLLRGRGPARRT